MKKLALSLVALALIALASAPAAQAAADGKALYDAKCAMCHSAALATNGLNLSTYADTIKGANDGPVIVPGDSANSKLFQIQALGGHPGQLTAEELAIVSAWIDAGALEK